MLFILHSLPLAGGSKGGWEAGQASLPVTSKTDIPGCLWEDRHSCLSIFPPCAVELVLTKACPRESGGGKEGKGVSPKDWGAPTLVGGRITPPPVSGGELKGVAVGQPFLAVH